ncbi:hypothetical protein Q5752_002067 [Cryptotrichosporon argae]
MAASLQHFGRGALRVAKNYTKGYTDTQTKVRDATSNDPWGPAGKQMNEIAQLTYNQNDFVEIMEMLDKRLNDKGKNWRHVFKALTLLDYCLHAGSENVVIYFRDNIYIIKTLKEFVYVDDTGKDVGSNVRQKAKDITNLLQDEDRLRAERRARGAMRDRMLGNIENSGLRGEDDYGAPRSPPPARREQPRPGRNRDEDEDLQRALAESLESGQDDERRRSQRMKEEDELQRAIRLSEEEDARRKREQEEANSRALLDDSFQLQSNNQYGQMNAMPTGGFPLVDVGMGYGQQLQPQYTSFNPFHQQMMQQQQQEEYMRQQMLLQQQQQQQQHEEWARQQYLLQQQQQQQQQSLFAQPTGYGSNNPFAPRAPAASPQPQPVEQQSSFLPVPQVQAPPQQPAPQPIEPQVTARPAFNPPPKKDDGQHSQLANLLARGREDGMDTFGNTGNLRIPTGQPFHQSNRMAMQQTGNFGANNPFGQRQAQQGSTNDQPFFSV